MSIAKPRNLAVIDTLSAGYGVLHRRLWLLALPVALSAYLWLGTPLALDTAGELRPAIAELLGGRGDEGALGERWADQLLAGDARLSLAWLNLVPVLGPASQVTDEAIALRGPLQLGAAALAINLLALLLSSLYLALLGEAVRGEPIRPGASLRRAGRVAMELLLALLALVGLGLLLALPLLAISAILIVALPGATLLVLLAWYVALFWAYVYTGFTPEAIALRAASPGLGRVGPLRAIAESVRLVRHDLAATLRMLLLSLLIASGLGIVWRQLAATPPGLALAILGSAYVGSGLAAARLVFLRQRLAQRGGVAPHKILRTSEPVEGRRDYDHD